MMYQARTIGAIAALVCTFILTPPVARAQSTDAVQSSDPVQSPTPGPVQSPAAIPTTAPASTGLFGDFGGARSALAAKGITFRGRIVVESAANPIGGFQQGTALAGELALGSDVDFGKLYNNGLGIFHLTLTAREGSSLSANAIGNLFPVQEIFGDGLTPRLTEASYEQTFAGKKIDLELGRVITENDFAASPTYWGGNLYCTYQSNAICGTPIAVPINSGYDAYPQSVWGARLKVSPTPHWYFEMGGYQVSPNYSLRGNGFNLGFGGTTGTYLPFETGIMSLDAHKVATGSLRVGAYYDTSSAATVQSQITRFATSSSLLPASLPSTVVRGRYGYWVQADHLIAGGAGPNERGTAIYAAYNFGDAQTALLKDFFDAGIVQHGTFPGRDHDTFAIGYAYGNINPNLRAFEASLNAIGFNVPVNGQEQIAEVNYGLQLRPWLSLRPGIQYVWRPSGNTAVRNALVIDLSTAITF
jgi:porin